ncbi:hypothetical protein HY025_03835, partial [Candidatus Daviesbacteria bacterium]|nr:hypothetical protein [Candidatus Daviesbacteria bacterium]
VLRHELAALLATLFFIVPTPFFKNGLPLIDAVLLGDGAHGVAFSFLPLVLMYVQEFISTGFFKSGTVAAILIALIAIISPFAFFNLLIIFTILAISDGFLGDLRIKLIRSLSLVFFSLALSFFWYYPNLLNQIVLLNHVVFAFNKFVSILPLAVPGIPIIGTIAFLVFDRREKLRPFFIAIALFLIYFALYSLSKSISITGLFTYYRYVSELSFAISFGLALFLSLIIEVFVRNYILKTKSSFLRNSYLILGTILVCALAVTSLISVKIVHNQIENSPIKYQNTVGIGNIKRVFDFQNFSSILALFISLSALVILLSLLLKSNLSTKNSIFNVKKAS